MNQMTSWSAPGCPPSSCFDPTALLGCYSDIQALTALISKIVENLAATDPAFQQSLVDAIVKSGSNIPLIGITNGTDAQPGQVGEYVRMGVQVPYTTAPLVGQVVTMGVLQPGDWDVWSFATFTTYMAGAQYILQPLPAGFEDQLFAADQVANTGGQPVAEVGLVLVTSTARALITVPSLITFMVWVNNQGAGPGPGIMDIVFSARRRR